MDDVLYQKRVRIVELVLLLSIAFLPSFFKSMFWHLRLYSESGSSNAIFFMSIVVKSASIGLLFYLLFRQGRSIRDIGFSFKWKDIPKALLILAVIALSKFIYDYAIVLITGNQINYTPEIPDFFRGKITVIYVIAILINPFFEELILRAYLMSEIEFLSDSKILPIVISVVVQTSAHLYEGWPSMRTIALYFLVFSVYYAKSKRIMPIIIAHGVFDIGSMLYYGKF